MIDADIIACWRINYGLDSRGPEHAARWWHEMNDGKAPAGAVAALGLCLEEIKNHAAFVARVREIAEKLIEGDPANSTDGPDCTCQCCIRKQLLEVCNG